MLTGLVILTLTIVVVGLVPVAMMAGLFAIVDYLSDDEKLREIRQANREGHPVDFSRTNTTADDAEETLQVVKPPSELDAPSPEDDSDRPHARASSTKQCPDCGEENDGEFDRCWNCQATL